MRSFNCPTTVYFFQDVSCLHNSFQINVVAYTVITHHGTPRMFFMSFPIYVHWSTRDVDDMKRL